jgi:hypothetical protein
LYAKNELFGKVILDAVESFLNAMKPSLFENNNEAGKHEIIVYICTIQNLRKSCGKIEVIKRKLSRHYGINFFNSLNS